MLNSRIAGGSDKCKISPMAKYLYRTCPKCKDYLGIVVPSFSDSQWRLGLSIFNRYSIVSSPPDDFLVPIV